MIYDVAIIGAGPAGSSAGYELAKNGLKVVILDKEKFPRFKPCAGGLSLKTCKLLDFDIDNVLEREIRTARIFYKSDRCFEIAEKNIIGWTVNRKKFDLLLIEKAIRQGAEFRDDNQAESIEINPSKISIGTKKEKIFSRFVIGADGALSWTARFLDLAYPERVVSVVTEIAIDDNNVRDNFLGFDFGMVPGGYAWIFPLREKLSVGIYTTKQRVNSLYLLEEFIAKQGLAKNKRIFSKLGGVIPLGGIKQNLIYDKIILAGDAAGLVDPFLGEGIYYAIKSGTLAAKSIIDFLKNNIPINSYSEKIYNEMTIPFQRARKIGAFAYSFPQLSYMLIKRSKRFQNFVTDIITGKRSYKR